MGLLKNKKSIISYKTKISKKQQKYNLKKKHLCLNSNSLSS